MSVLQRGLRGMSSFLLLLAPLLALACPQADWRSERIELAVFNAAGGDLTEFQVLSLADEPPPGEIVDGVDRLPDGGVIVTPDLLPGSYALRVSYGRDGGSSTVILPFELARDASIELVRDDAQGLRLDLYDTAPMACAALGARPEAPAP